MNKFESMALPVERTSVAPDGLDVRALLGLEGGIMAHFELGAGETSIAVAHKTVEEIWYVLSGRVQGHYYSNPISQIQLNLSG